MGLVFLAKLVGVVVDTMVLAPVIGLTATVDPQRAYRLSLVWARVALAVAGVQVRATRRAPLDPARPYVFMSNHASHFDVLAVVAALPEFQLRWVAKRELVDVPIFGWALKRAGHIVIDRANHEQAVASLRAAKAQMDAGVSVMIFPEGTRGDHDGQLLPLKKGGFVLAIEMGVPIVPLAVRGSRAILPRDDWRIHGGEIEVIVGEPIPVAGADRDTLVAAVEAFLERELPATLVEVTRRTAEAR